MTAVTELRTALAGRYELEGELGQGGMAIVYRARDVRHERSVAIKVLRVDILVAQGAERFLREIRTAARLQHPHILPVHDSGEAAGQLFYVMPHVEGESLRQLLEREGPLPLDAALAITHEVADALDHAHQHGVVHRDIKPENILLSGGHALVTDFGIARAADAAGLRLTESGMAVGTPLYMSPEQATGALDVDGRTDIYALGCVLYEMLAGSPPFGGPTAQAVMARHTTDAVPPLRTVRQEVPQSLERVVVKALAKLPVDRWQTGREMAEALSRAERGSGDRRTADNALVRWGIATAGLLVVATGAWLVAGRDRGYGVANPVQTVAVLPFRMSGDTLQAILAEGLTEGVTTGLVRVPGIGVVASERVRGYQDRSLDAQRAGRQLGVSAVVTAGVLVAGNRLRVTAQLTNVADGLVRWREQFDGDLVVGGQLADLFTIQDAITVRIVDALRVRLSTAQREALVRGARTRDPVAYRLYLEGLRETYENFGASTPPRAAALFRAAIARDSLYADAWAGLAIVASLDLSGNTSDAVIAARRPMERALELDPRNPFALVTRGWLRAQYEWDWDRAWQDLRQAVDLAPASAELALEYSAFLVFVNEPDSAVAWGRRAVTLMPANGEAWGLYAYRLLFAGQPDSALSALARAQALDAKQPLTLVALLANMRLGRRGAADSVAAWELAQANVDADRLAAVAAYYGFVGEPARARAVLQRLLALARREHVSPSRIATASLAAGDRQGALTAMEDAARERDSALPHSLWVFLRTLRGEPRYEAVWKRVYGDRPLPRAFM